MKIEEEIYKLYPRKVGRGDALKAIRKAIQRLPNELQELNPSAEDGVLSVINEVEWLKEKIRKFSISDAARPDGLFDGYTPPHPSTWFNAQRYLDDESEWMKKNGRQIGTSKAAERVSHTRQGITDTLRNRIEQRIRHNGGEQQDGDSEVSNRGNLPAVRGTSAGGN